MKSTLWIALVVAILVAAILLYTPEEPASVTEPEPESERTLKEEPQNILPADPTVSKTPSPELLPQVTMTAVDYKIDFFALERESKNPPFEFRGGAGNGRVTDRNGRALLKSSEEVGIYGALVSPDKRKVLVKAANPLGGAHLVFDPSTGDKIKLPPNPPGANMYGLGNWSWIGANQLFASSGIQAFDDNGEPVTSCEGHNTAETKFYSFDLVTEQLYEVVMPDAVKQPVVHAVDVMSDGHVNLWHEEPHEGVEQDLGWFKIEVAG